jgi:hypothetical protein
MRYCLLIDDPSDVAKIEKFLTDARNLRIDINLPGPIGEPDRDIEEKPTIMFCDQGQSVSYFVRAELEVGSEATGSDGTKWP